jgi:hypothetical protein
MRTIKFPILVSKGMTPLQIGKLIKHEEEQSQLELGLLLTSLSKFYQSSLATSYKMALKTFKAASLPQELLERRDEEISELLCLDLDTVSSNLSSRMTPLPATQTIVPESDVIVDDQEEK